MRLLHNTLIAAACAGLFVVALPARAHADEYNKQTFFTFNTPVELPGVTLPAGTYMFELADPANTSSVVRVFNQEGTVCYGTFLTTPDLRRTVPEEPAISLAERAPNAPQQITAWFYPDEREGWAFTYPHRANG